LRQKSPSPNPSRQGRGIRKPSPLAGEGRERGNFKNSNKA
jgi:hypothetical protein